MEEIKFYVAEYVLASKEPTAKANFRDANSYFEYFSKYFNKKQNEITISELMEIQNIDDEIHIFVKLNSKILNINDVFEYMNSQGSLAYADVMKDTNDRLWGDITRVYKLDYFTKALDGHKKNNEQLTTQDGWIPLEKLREAIRNAHIVIHPKDPLHDSANPMDPWDGMPVKEKEVEDEQEKSSSDNT